MQGLKRLIGFKAAVGVVACRGIHVESILKDGTHDNGTVAIIGGHNIQAGGAAGHLHTIQLEVAEGATGPRRRSEGDVIGQQERARGID